MARKLTVPLVRKTANARSCIGIIILFFCSYFIRPEPLYFRKAEPKPIPPTKGALYFGYHADLNTSLAYVATIAKSAQSIKKYSPNIKIAIASNAPVTDAVFDDVIHIPESMIFPGRHWWTRIVSLNETPYDYTLSIDSDRIVCSNISQGFDFLEDYDMLHVSAGILPAFDNGVMFYKRGDKFNALVQKWMEFQLKYNQFGNDQYTLAEAIDASPGFSSGVLQPAWQVKYMPAKGLGWGKDTNISRTLVIHGEIKIAAGSLCFVDSDIQRSRLYAWDKNKDPPRQIVYSQQECDLFLDGLCENIELDWTFNDNVIPRSEYLAKFGFNV